MSVQLAPELALVVSFHGVVERIDHPEIQVNHLELASFERIVDHIRERFTVVSLDDLSAALAGEARLPAHAAVLTFDDGYRSVFEHVDPILRRHGLPYAVFVPPGLVDARARVPTYVMRTALEFTDARSVRLPGSRRALKLRSQDDRARATDRAAEALRSLPRAEADTIVRGASRASARAAVGRSRPALRERGANGLGRAQPAVRRAVSRSVRTHVTTSCSTCDNHATRS